MDDGGFYVTLPFNSSQSVYSDNKISSYRTKLARPLLLRGNWEVGLCEIQYPRTWETFTDEYATIILTNKNNEVTGIKLRVGYYSKLTDIVDEINKQSTAYGVTIGYDDVIKKNFIATKQEVNLTFYGKLSSILGFEDSVVIVLNADTNKGKKYADHVADLFGGDYTLFVYTDIIEYQVVGDHFVPLLRCVQITGKNKEIITINYDKPHYVRVSKRHISDIAIEVKTDQNYNVPFKYGKVVVKLHFRPMKQTHHFLTNEALEYICGPSAICSLLS